MYPKLNVQILGQKCVEDKVSTIQSAFLNFLKFLFLTAYKICDALDNIFLISFLKVMLAEN